MYKLRADVKIRDEEDLDVVTATKTLQNCVASGPDPATALLGSRGVVEKGSVEGEAPGLYLRRRLALGVAEGVELEGAVPLVANLDVLNAIAFDKGCYLGQELTARAKFRGQVRRRFMPVALHETDVTHSAARAEPPADPRALRAALCGDARDRRQARVGGKDVPASWWRSRRSRRRPSRT